MENIHAMQDLLEQMYAICIPFENFIKIYFEQLTPVGWFKSRVADLIENNYKKDAYYYEEPKSLENLDFAQLIYVLRNKTNWYNLRDTFYSSKLFTQANYDLLKNAKDIRDRVAHHYHAGENLKQYYDDCATLETLAEFFGTTIETCIRELHVSEKVEINEIISKKVIVPALLSPSLDQKTKDSVKDTEKRLNAMVRASGVYDFFRYSLEGIRGKEICENLHKNKLLAFEDIKYEVENAYLRK